jgi:DNA-binding response OmpR family regulator
MSNAIFTLLVVDDEETMRRTLADILSLEGYQVETASGGDEAINKCAKTTFDLILLDLTMPGVDGLEVLKFVTSKLPASSSSGTPAPVAPTVILLTAHGSLESAIEALRFGASDYLLKPSSPEQILKSVAKALQARTQLIQNRALLAQVEQSLLGSSAGGHRDAPTPLSMIYQLPNAITIDLERREIYYKNIILKLTPAEGKLMAVFLGNPRHVFSHRELVLRVQGYETTDWEAPEVLRPLVSRLRHKLIELPDGDRWISSVRGTGYVFEIEGVRLTG